MRGDSWFGSDDDFVPPGDGLAREPRMMAENFFTGPKMLLHNSCALEIDEMKREKFQVT